MPAKNVRHTARGIVIHDNKLLLMERWRDDLHYFSVPGGGIEQGETAPETVVRELMEETCIGVAAERLLYIMHEKHGSKHYVYLCSYLSGKPELAANSPEAKKHAGGKNLFVPRWIELTKLAGLSFLTWEPIRLQLLLDLQSGFAHQTKDLPAIS